MKLGNVVVGPDGARTTNDPAYLAPPHGGGACITGRDCFDFNGTCVNGQCSCLGPFTGSYCQLNRPDFAAAAIMKKRATALKEKEKEKDRDPNKGQTMSRTQPSQESNSHPKTPPVTSSKTPTASLSDTEAKGEVLSTVNAQKTQSSQQTQPIQEETIQQQAQTQIKPQQKVKKRKPKPKPKPSSSVNSEQSSDDDNHDPQEPAIPATGGIINAESGSGSDVPVVILPSRLAEEEQMLLEQQPPSIEELYGEGRAYPEPFTAGRLPSAVLNDRHRRRLSREQFLYAVRYRSGPLGLTFDNNKSNATIVEKVVRGQQSELSDVREGDALVAVDAYNVSIAPARLTQRLLSSLSWPRILVFEARYKGDDPQMKELLLRKRTFNMSVLYPPTLVSSDGDNMAFRTADWTPSFLNGLFTPQTEKVKQNLDTAKIRGFCPLYRLVGVKDPFGCNPTVDKDKIGFTSLAYGLTNAEEEIIKHNGFVSAEIEAQSRYLSLLLQEAFVRKIGVEVRPAAIMKRGSCTFVEKAKTLPTHGATLGLVVNADEELLDMPAGKEKTDGCNVPLGLMRLKDGNFLQQTSRGADPIYIIASPFKPSAGDKNNIQEDMSPEEEAGRLACERLQQLSEDLLDKWPHSVPSLSVTQILAIKPPDQSKVRGLTEEGGRVALSGANGWAFFDYHLAMFGPQEVPLGPQKLVMAQPPHGCDPNAYTVRISGSIVGILRGGGCSFGIKVINAQKLGAVAVMILNTDDAKTMRLMALPDEVPLIQIPCVMVSRRLQFYVEQQLKKYPATVDLMLVSIQPTGVFGEYEKKNTLVLPPRLDNVK